MRAVAWWDAGHLRNHLGGLGFGVVAFIATASLSCPAQAQVSYPMPYSTTTTVAGSPPMPPYPHSNMTDLSVDEAFKALDGTPPNVVSAGGSSWGFYGAYFASSASALLNDAADASNKCDLAAYQLAEKKFGYLISQARNGLADRDQDLSEVETAIEKYESENGLKSFASARRDYFGQPGSAFDQLPEFLQNKWGAAFQQVREAQENLGSLLRIRQHWPEFDWGRCLPPRRAVATPPRRPPPPPLPPQTGMVIGSGSVLQGNVLSGDVLQGIGVTPPAVNQPNRGADESGAGQSGKGKDSGPGHQSGPP
jgi:hypothetical protein